MLALEKYLAVGPAHWPPMKVPKIPAGIKITTSGGRLKDNEPSTIASALLLGGSAALRSRRRGER